MKYLPILLGMLWQFSMPLFSQTVAPDLRAVVHEGSIAIVARDLTVFNALFHLEQDSTISLDFYFEPDHPDNGRYYAAPTTQVAGEILLAFPELLLTEGDSLTFSALEVFGDSSLGEYIFIRGTYRGSGDPVNQCPSRIDCGTNGKSLWLYFDPGSLQIGALSATSLSVFLPGSSLNGHYFTGLVSLNENALIVRSIDNFGDCVNAIQGQVTILINGLTCIFENGLPVGSDNCSPWGEYYANNPDCAGIIENCAPQILALLSENKNNLPCEQWIDPAQACNTTSMIQRPGKVAIGTTGFANTRLTVKNGIVTDRVKVQQSVWGDYVFEPDYLLRPLADVEAHIRQYRHLPEMPSAADIEASGGLDLGYLAEKQQVKIEELFLHLIALEKQLRDMEQELLLFEFLEIKQVR